MCCPVTDDEGEEGQRVVLQVTSYASKEGFMRVAFTNYYHTHFGVLKPEDASLKISPGIAYNATSPSLREVCAPYVFPGQGQMQYMLKHEVCRWHSAVLCSLLTLEGCSPSSTHYVCLAVRDAHDAGGNRGSQLRHLAGQSSARVEACWKVPQLLPSPGIPQWQRWQRWPVW